MNTRHPLRFATTLTMFAMTTLLIIALSAMTSCDQNNPTNTGPTIGLIDLERVASELGHTQTWQQTITTQQQTAQQTLANIDRQYAQQLEQMRTRAGQTPTPEQEQEMARFVRSAQQRMQREIANAQQQFERTHNTLLSQFRDEIKPFVRQLAQDNNLVTIFIQSDSMVLYTDDTADLTDKLINKLIANGQQNTTSTTVNPPLPAPATPTTHPTPTTHQPDQASTESDHPNANATPVDASQP